MAGVLFPLHFATHVAAPSTFITLCNTSSQSRYTFGHICDALFQCRHTLIQSRFATFVTLRMHFVTLPLHSVTTLLHVQFVAAGP